MLITPTLNRPPNKYKRAVFLSLLWLSVIASFGLAVINIFQTKYILAGLEAMLTALSLYMLYRLSRIDSEKQLMKLTTVFLCVSLSVMMYAFARKGAPLSVYLWVFIIPVASYQLAGLSRGLTITTVFLTISGLLYFYRYTSGQPVAQSQTMINACICLVCIWVLSCNHTMAQHKDYSQLSSLAYHDSLTGLLNRSSLTALFEQHAYKTVGVILLDIDDFKAINDTYGHDIGDTALQRLAECLIEHVGINDHVFRLGGEEFCVLLPKASEADTARIANKLIMQISYRKINTGDGYISLTASAGAAHYPTHGDSLSNILKSADERLYFAKKFGKNQVVATHMY